MQQVYQARLSTISNYACAFLGERNKKSANRYKSEMKYTTTDVVNLSLAKLTAYNIWDRKTEKKKKKCSKQLAS